MKKTPKNRIFFIIMTVLTVLFISFIFIHSSKNADISTDESLATMGFFQSILNALGIPVSLTDYIIRKTAHFGEFGLLGVLVSLTFYSYDKQIKNLFKRILSVFFICLTTAITDETIQLFVPGRSGQVTDILLDFSGSFTGVIGIYIILYLIFILKNKKEKGNKRQ